MSMSLGIGALCLVSLSVALTTRRFWAGLLISTGIVLPSLMPLSLWTGYFGAPDMPAIMLQLRIVPFLLSALVLARLASRIWPPPPLAVAFLTLWIVLEISGYLTFGRFPPYWTYLDQGIWMLFPVLGLAIKFGRPLHRG